MKYSAFAVPIVTLFTSFLAVMDLAQFRYSKNKLFVILAVELTIQALINGSILYFLGYETYVRLFFFTVDIPAFITFIYISKFRDMRDVFTTMVIIFISIAISIPSIWISSFINAKYYAIYNLTRLIVFFLVFMFLHIFIRKPYKQLQNELKKGWGIFSILPAIGFVFLYYQYLQYGIEGNNTSMLINSVGISFLIVIVFWVLYYVFQQLHEKYLVQEQQRIFSMQNKAQLDQFEQQKEMAEKSNRRWHDFRHSIQELIELMEAGETEAALAYLKEQRGMSEVPKVEYCLHTAVNSILCLWAERSRKAGIEVTIHTDVPNKLEIDPMELSALFANAFENAFDGCLRLPEDEPKFIKVDSHYNGKHLAIGFTNSCNNNIRFENDMPVSTKSGGGIGTRSIAYTVKRFRGTVYFTSVDHVFSARFVLKI